MKTRMAGLRTEQSSTVMKLALLKRKLARLDREWIRFREAALVRDSNGGREPSAFKCVLAAGAMTLLGLLVAGVPWLAAAFVARTALLVITAIGMAILCIGWHRLTEGLSKTSRFNRQRRRYQTRRREIVALIRHEQSR
ncbi:hypothetical protein [Luteolibacter sp. LG18]|uniref:hypothetical protein n=1 Tax=Luteolibacter sp. LG18 TaxID=2819286 RepID=UPI0030C6826A